MRIVPWHVHGTCTDVDVVVPQRPMELDGLAESWLAGRRPGRDVPAVYLEHNTPPSVTGTPRHIAADRDDLHPVHVTHFNALMWGVGTTRSTAVEQGIPDPGHASVGDVPHAAVVINEPARRGRVCGHDALDRFAEVARRRLYLHPYRWTSLGLSLLEAMALGVPAVAFATTEAADALACGAGVVSNDWQRLTTAIRRLVEDPGEAARLGARGRDRVLRRYGLDRFLCDWDEVLEEVAA